MHAHRLVASQIGNGRMAQVGHHPQGRPEPCQPIRLFRVACGVVGQVHRVTRLELDRQLLDQPVQDRIVGEAGCIQVGDRGRIAAGARPRVSHRPPATRPRFRTGRTSRRFLLTAELEQPPEALQGAGVAGHDGPGGDAQDRADLGGRKLLEMAEDEDFAVAGGSSASAARSRWRSSARITRPLALVSSATRRSASCAADSSGSIGSPRPSRTTLRRWAPMCR